MLLSGCGAILRKEFREKTVNKYGSEITRFFSNRNNLVTIILLVAIIAIAGLSTYLILKDKGQENKTPVKNNAVTRQYQEKLPSLKADSEKSPDDAAAQIAYAQALYVTGDKSSAKDYYLKALEINPKDGETLNKLGNTYRDLGKHSEAGKAYKDAYAVQPGLLNAYVNLATMQAYTLGKSADAVKTYELAVSKIGQTPEVLNLLAGAYEQNDQKERAINTYNDVLEKDPKNQAAKQNIERLSSQ